MEPSRAFSHPAPLAASQPAKSLTASDLFREHASFVWRALRRLGVREADVDDACQEVFMVVHRKLDGFEGRSSLRTWLYGIAVRVASAERRAAKSRPPPAPSSGPELVDARTPYEASVEAQALARLDRALDLLDEDKRAVFVLYEVEELTMAEVAEALSCPLQTAYSRHAAAKENVESYFRKLALVEGSAKGPHS